MCWWHNGETGFYNICLLQDQCRLALADAGLEAAEVDDVILVGGMTRMPRVAAKVREVFGRDPLLCKLSDGVHPDEVVAGGAAIQGFVMDGEGGSGVVPLRDVTAHSLGIMVAGGLCDPQCIR